jgi:hypothetical protein
MGRVAASTFADVTPLVHRPLFRNQDKQHPQCTNQSLYCHGAPEFHRFSAGHTRSLDGFSTQAVHAQAESVRSATREPAASQKTDQFRQITQTMRIKQKESRARNR